MLTDWVQASIERGFVHQATDLEGLRAQMRAGPLVSYCGFDATAPSLHVGNLVSLMWLRLLGRMGHKPIMLLGGATSEVGDPSFRAADRPYLSTQTIEDYIATIKPVADRIVPNVTIVNNADWLKKLNYLEFLRDYGRHFSVNRMLSFDSVQLRLERDQSLSFLEFNYMILQAYDFVHLHRAHDCMLQLGGSDQWGNIINGVELARRLQLPALYGITCPLITTANGQKMGKTADGAVWLNADMRTPFDYWQFWRNTADADVGHFLRLFTDLSIDEICRLESLRDAEINVAKKILADEATALCHGREILDDIHRAIAQQFEGSSGTGEGLPEHRLPSADLPISIESLLVRCGFASSKGEVRRLIEGKGAKMNDELIASGSQVMDATMFPLKLSVGKKRHIRVILQSFNI